MADSLELLKVEAEGLVTSFRYPYFAWQKHPTFEMPPPATIYGHICSTVGELIDPAGLQFAYRFTYESKTEDLEHIWSWDERKKRDTVKPFRRELLFRPRLTLYINRSSLIEHFKSPYYVVVLGRSQDLFTYRNVEVVKAIKEKHAYYEHTLLPLEMLTRLRKGVAVTMPRFLDYWHQRTPTSGQYVVLRDKVVYPGLNAINPDGPFVYSDDPDTRWVDPTERDHDGVGRGLVFHTFVD